MGLYLSSLIPYKTRSQIALDMLKIDEKFICYQYKFLQLTPSRKLYIDGNDLVIETYNKSSYSMIRSEYDWSSPSSEPQVFDYLDKLYDLYDNTKMTDGAVSFVKESLSETIDNWVDWFEDYFHYESPGYKLFESISDHIKPESYRNSKGVLTFPPQLIWTLMLIDADNIISRNSTNEKILKDYPNAKEILTKDQNHDPKEILTKDPNEINSEGEILAIVAWIDNKWWYVGITNECFKKIKKNDY